MVNVKVQFEYALKATSKSILWTAISTPSGLEGWFSDQVIGTGKRLTFQWGKTERREAQIIATKTFVFIRFKWIDEEAVNDQEEELEEQEFFEIKMNRNELTGDYMLEITDFAEPGEEEDVEGMWDAMIAKLRWTCGF